MPRPAAKQEAIVSHRAKYNAEEVRRRNLLRNYGLTPQEYEEMVAGQLGLCAICGRSGAKLYIDHSHVTGAVRGLLCNSCNYGLGVWQDNQELLLKAALYLHQASLKWADEETASNGLNSSETHPTAI